MGPVCIITGANSGIGFETTLKMAKLGYNVIMACRNQSLANNAVDKVRHQIPGANVIFMELDLASLRSIERFVECFLKSKKSLEVLINNAGLFPEYSNKSPTFTEDGFESTFGVNHIGHFYLTLLLLEKLKQCSPSRIVMVSSTLHDPEKVKSMKRRYLPHIDFDNLQLTEPNTFDSFLAYSNSKLANVLFTKELSRKLAGSGVQINSLCPGWIPSTNLGNLKTCKKCCLLCCFHYMCRCCKITRSVGEGSDCVVFVAVDKSLTDVSGKHFFDCKEIVSSEESCDIKVAERLWDVSIDMLNLAEDSPVKLVLRY